MTDARNALPTGNVTLLMTDIEGSTEAWQAAPQDMTASVTRHYEILDAAVTAHNGRRPEEQGEGDSVVAGFANHRDAVAAALDIQLALQQSLPELPVRMALHTGEALLRNEKNYAGLTIIRCARIRNCGYGAQILVSDETHRLIEDNFPPGTGAMDLGVYGLKGLAGRERIWQLTHPGLRVNFPPLKAGSSASGNLTTPISSFVGRRNDLASLSHLLAEHRFITITGEAGVGKSRLAAVAAGAGTDWLPGGIWRVALGDVTDDVNAVAVAIAQECSIDRTDDDPVEVVAQYFGSMAATVIILDGCDQVPAAASHLIERILGRCPEARVLATRRSPQGIAGEVAYNLSPLATPPDSFSGTMSDLAEFAAARLFIERATTANSRLEIHEADVADIARICRHLRGVPLGLELAARTTLGSFRELADSLVEVAERHDANDRTGAVPDTIGSSIAWSYQLLTPNAQAVLCRLAVFRRSFEIEAATAVAGTDDLVEAAVFTGIQELLDKQLLSVDSDGRLALSPTVREFGRGRLLRSGEAEGVFHRHRSWFADVAERFAKAGDEVPVSLLAPDETDIYDALDSAIRGADPAVAYRIIIALGDRWPQLDRPDVVEAAVNWIVSRSPSDGERAWSAAVARLQHVSRQADSPIHGFADEAQAISELVGDADSARYFAADAAH